jgi:hypothetical protein
MKVKRQNAKVKRKAFNTSSMMVLKLISASRPESRILNWLHGMSMSKIIAQPHLESEILNRLHAMDASEIIAQSHPESGILNRLQGMGMSKMITQSLLESGILNLESAEHLTRPYPTAAPLSAQRER